MKRIASLLLIIALIFSFQTPAWAVEAETEQLPNAYHFTGVAKGIYRVNTDQGSKGVSFETFADALKAIELGKVNYDSRGNGKFKEVNLIESASSYGWSKTPETATFYISMNGSETSFTIDGDLEIKNNICFNNAFDKPTTICFNGKITISNGGTLRFTRVIDIYSSAQPISVQFSNPVIVKPGGRLEIWPSKGGNVTNDTYELTAASGSLFNIGSEASAYIGQVSVATANGNNEPIISNSGDLELGDAIAGYDRPMYSGPNTVVAVQEGGSLTVNVAEFHTTGDNPAVTVAEGAAIEFITSTIVEGEFAPTDQITAEKAVAVELAAGATVKRDESVNVVVSAEQGGAGDNYVDNDGNIILAAGAKTDEDTLENAAVILPDGTIIQGSKDEAPTIDKADDGTTTVTVPAGGSVQKPGGAWVDMPAGGTADSAGNVTAVPVAIVTFENADIEPIMVLPGTTITLPTPDDTRDAIFRYWTVAGDPIGTRYYGGEEFTAGENVTFVANWKDNSYIPVPPTQPTRPTEPDEPDEPDTPDVPDEPDTPDVPDKPDIPAPGYVDVPATAWYYDAVKYAVENGLMSGTGTYTFQPNTTLSRGMIAQMLYALEGKPSVSATNSFTDVSANDWYAKAASWTQSKGIITGYKDNTFKPTKVITRAELAKILYYYLGTSLSTAGKAYTGSDLKSDTANVTISESCTLSDATIDGYAVCKLNLSSSEKEQLVTSRTIQLYDEVIVEGTDLYDGKML